MNQISIIEGIIIGAVGGAIAGAFLWVLNEIKIWIVRNRDTKKVVHWLTQNTAPNSKTNQKWRSTRAIASHNNLTEERVRYIASYSNSIVLDTSEANRNEEMWGIKSSVRPNKNKR